MFAIFQKEQLKMVAHIYKFPLWGLVSEDWRLLPSKCCDFNPIPASLSQYEQLLRFLSSMH